MARGYTPIVRASVDGRPITSLLSPRLVEASVSDGTGVEDDRLIITVDNPGDQIGRPRKGAKVLFAGGYRETGLDPLAISLLKMWRKPPQIAN